LAQTAPKKTTGAKTSITGPIQFDWRKEWKKRVKPHLQNPFVDLALNFGMILCDRGWNPGDAPYLVGAIGFRPSAPRKGTLDWYRPLRRCHFISFFSLLIGVINYPELEWRIVSGRCHTVPVGYDKDGEPRVVMDILLFERYTAEESIEFALRGEPTPCPVWQHIFRTFEVDFASACREALANQDKHPPEHYLAPAMARLADYLIATLIKRVG
jgi:hypothetical protein